MMIWSRRRFIGAGAFVAAWLLRPDLTRGLDAPSRYGALRPGLGDHPTPRAGITGSRVLAAAKLAATPALVPLFDGIRAIPQVVDGIRCHCGCADAPAYYSLLTCYEGPTPMARDCPTCQGQGRLVVRLHAEGKSLDQIRAAVDAKFG